MAGGGKSGKGAGSEREAGKEVGETGNSYTTLLYILQWKKGKEEEANKIGAGAGVEGYRELPSPCLPRHPNFRLNPLLPVKIVRLYHSQFLEHVLLA